MRYRVSLQLIDATHIQLAGHSQKATSRGTVGQKKLHRLGGHHHHSTHRPLLLPGMLGDRLACLDIPSDGSARLVSVATEIDEQGCKTWRLVFKEKPKMGGDVTPTHQAQPAQAVGLKAQGACADEKCNRSCATPTVPQKSVSFDVLAFAPSPACTPPPRIVVPQRAVPAKSPKSAHSDGDMLMDRIFPLRPVVKTYAWGRFGDASLVGRLALEGLDDFELGETTPYAELWMGSHPSGMSMVMLSSPWRTVTPLSEWIKLNPSLLGPARHRKRADDDLLALHRRASMKRLAATSLPFLFKVLSVRTALSIQAHPDKALAQKLHVRYPDQYKDDNHKPEMSVAITPFEALCSFQPAYSILENLRATPELVALVGEAVVSALDDATNARAAAARRRGGPQRRRLPPRAAGALPRPDDRAGRARGRAARRADAANPLHERDAPDADRRARDAAARAVPGRRRRLLRLPPQLCRAPAWRGTLHGRQRAARVHLRRLRGGDGDE